MIFTQWKLIFWYSEKKMFKESLEKRVEILSKKKDISE